jgi:SpoIIAA-like
MIEQLQGFPGDVVGFLCKGFVTRRDYEDVLVPAVEQALKTHDKLRLYYEIDPEFTGIEPSAMWEDFKVGMEHLLRWERIAVVTDIDWIAHTMRAFGFMMPGAVRVFPLKGAAEARKWLVAESG